MQIKEVADRSGFSPATLRYYEEIGLLPEAADALARAGTFVRGALAGDQRTTTGTA